MDPQADLLDNLLERCTVRISSEGKTGTGFFVSRKTFFVIRTVGTRDYRSA
jgi:hypothetical protein